MTKEEKKARVNYLWSRLRAASKVKGGLSYVVNKDLEKDRANFGLDSEIEDEQDRCLSESQELEE